MPSASEARERATLTPELRDRFRAALDALLPAGRLGLAVSGGPDSLALLLLAHDARPGTVMTATVDHGLRAEAADEAAMVAAVCARLNVPHTTLAVTIADDPRGVQAAARNARYAALGEWADAEGVTALATAHHMDDQAETILMRLARGAGIGGLSGIRRSRPLAEGSAIRLIRPLLDWRKTELAALVLAAGLEPARDPSNASPRYDRTRARALMADGWPAPQRLAAVADAAAEAEESLAWSARAIAAERITREGDAVLANASGLPREYRRRLLLAAILTGTPGALPRGDSLDRLLAALDRGEVATLAGLRCDPGPPWRFTPAPPRRSF